jgi:putative multiple sugar transport system substrate-binding protein
MLELGGYDVTYDDVCLHLEYAGVDINDMQNATPAQIARAIATDGPSEVADISGANQMQLSNYVSYGAYPVITIANDEINHALLMDNRDAYWVARSSVKTGLVGKDEIYEAYASDPGLRAIALLPKSGEPGESGEPGKSGDQNRSGDQNMREGGGAQYIDSKIGVVLPNSLESRWPMAYKQFRKADPNIRILFSDSNPATEFNNVKSLVDGGCKAIIICAVGTKSAAPAADYAKSKGAVVISYERMITDTSAIDYYIAFDHFVDGYLQGKYLADMAEGKGKGLNLYLYVGGEFDDSVFAFLPGSWAAIQPKLADGTFVVQNSPMANELKGRAELANDELLSVASPVYTQWDPAVAESLARENLSALPKSAKGDVFVLAPNDDTSRAITDAFRADQDVSGVFSTGQDFTKESIQYIIDAKQGMTIAKLDQALVQGTMRIIDAVFSGQDPAETGICSRVFSNGTIEIPCIVEEGTLVTINNVRNMIRQSGLYFISEFNNLDKLENMENLENNKNIKNIENINPALSPAPNPPGIAMTLNGSAVFSDASPYINDNIMMAPARFVCEALGARVDWEGETNRVSINLANGEIIQIKISALNLLAIGQGGSHEVAMDAPALIKNGRTFVSVDFFAKALGLAVDWNEKAIALSF